MVVANVPHADNPQEHSNYLILIAISTIDCDIPGSDHGVTSHFWDLLIVRPMKFESLTGKKLLSIRLLSVGTHPAWVDSSSPQIATYAANLELADSTCVQVCPCEVPIAGKYPALGIELRDWSGSPGVQRWGEGEEYSVAMPKELDRFFPAMINDLRLWDSMGDGTLSALDLVLSTGPTLTLRHVFPPMMLGLDIRVAA